ncbi:MAG: hypothetical protein KatS3mg026_0473 [Bacteroidia bacterium]|nr:MAG: hypothetical protein KatS3mg026_0473 [Bacteroidia bacterium]
MDTVIALPALFQAIHKVGAYLREEFHHFSRSAAEYKTARDPVSYVDRTAEARLQEACARLLPEAGFVLEESGQNDRERELVWVIDPLDGTKNFVHGLPLFGISVALLHRGKPHSGGWCMPCPSTRLSGRCMAKVPSSVRSACKSAPPPTRTSFWW